MINYLDFVCAAMYLLAIIGIAVFNEKLGRQLIGVSLAVLWVVLVAHFKGVF